MRILKNIHINCNLYINKIQNNQRKNNLKIINRTFVRISLIIIFIMKIITRKLKKMLFFLLLFFFNFFGIIRYIIVIKQKSKK